MPQLQSVYKSELARHVLDLYAGLLESTCVLNGLKEDDRQRIFNTLMLLTDPNEVFLVEKYI